LAKVTAQRRRHQARERIEGKNSIRLGGKSERQQQLNGVAVGYRYLKPIAIVARQRRNHPQVAYVIAHVGQKAD
jgi:hypothetical protein